MANLRDLFDDLVRVEIRLWEAADGRLRRELDLPLGRVETLRAVAGISGCRVQDIADALAITVGAASKLVDRLQAADLCTRRAHPSDRRSSLVELTGAGRDVLRRAETLLDDELQGRLGDIPSADLDHLAALLSSARAALGRRDG